MTIQSVKPKAENITDEDLDAANGGIIAILIAFDQPTKDIRDGTSNTLAATTDISR